MGVSSVQLAFPFASHPEHLLTSSSLLTVVTVAQQLRAAFFEHLVGVSSFVGRESLQHFILPCILQALTDVNELVVEGCLRSLSGKRGTTCLGPHPQTLLLPPPKATPAPPQLILRVCLLAIRCLRRCLQRH